MLRLTTVLLSLFLSLILSYLLVSNYLQFQHNSVVIEELQTFKARGGRFTAADGRSHCLDIQELQRLAGTKVRECNFNESVESTE
jgi:hypothetical protein